MTTRTTIETASGSQYHVEFDAVTDTYWLHGVNVPNPQSTPLVDDGPWRIEKPSPWPPVVGEPLLLLSFHFAQPQHPGRIPGGGKHTSRVRSVVVTSL